MKTNSTQDFGHVAVLMGGVSSERDVSLESGQAVYESLVRQGIQATCIDTAHPFVDRLTSGEFDRAFIALHGGDGECGTIQGFLQTIQMPFTGCDMAASALAMDKSKTKIICNAQGVPTPRYQCVDTLQSCMDAAEDIGYPVCIKPVYEGSTIGVTKVDKSQDIEQAFELASQYGAVMVEKWIVGHDMTVSILNDEVLPAIMIQPKSGMYDYQAKYLSDETKYLCPAPITPEQTQLLEQYALKAYQAIGGFGWGRIDFMKDRKGLFWLLEVNTVPGMTSHSLVPTSAKAKGMSFDELVMVILASSINRPQQQLSNQKLAKTG